jgi:glycosyltransferase involved in cell wall biosynthesis
MRRVLLVQPSLQPPGGGNGVAAWMLQALIRDHRVTVLSWQPVNVGPINRFFGTSLRASDFDNIVLPRSWTIGADWLPVPAALLRSALLMRYTRRISDAFDVLLGVHNETDFGRRGIQYVHYPTYLRPRPQVDYRWYHRATPLLHAYYRVADRIADFSFERLRQNLTLANSNWTATRVKELLGITARTLYPPVVDPAPPLAWRERAPRFVAIGRISPEKEYERAIRILDRVRRHVPDLTLTIVGTWDRHTHRYAQELQRLAASLGSWVQFRRDLPRKELRELLARSRYGIHAMREEHFGMAPAEMVRAGMIVWVPRGGGQVEIVGDEPRLLYESEEEAAEQVARVISDEDAQAQLREYLESRSPLFGTERFVNEVRTLVANFTE